MGRRGVRGHSANPSGQRCAVTSSERPNAIDNASFAADRQDRYRNDISDYLGHLLRLAWRAAASLLLINASILNHLSRRSLGEGGSTLNSQLPRYSSSLTCSIQSTGLPFSAS